MERKKLTGLTAKAYEHPFDKKALDALHGTPGLELLFKKINEFGIEKMCRMQYTGSNLKVTPDNLPELYAVFHEVCDILDLGFMPELYIQWEYGINAMAIGVVKPMIVINSGCVDLLSREELMFVLGHEAGHLKSQHQLYHQMASVLPYLGELVGTATLGLGEILSQGLVLALLYWQRMSEFTADRAGLLACQDLNGAAKAMMKMAGMPLKYFDAVKVEAFIQQARDFEGYDYSALNRIAKSMLIMQQNHPWTVMRAAELLKWLELGEFDKLVKQELLSKGQAVPGSTCCQCGGALVAGAAFCPTCGANVAAKVLQGLCCGKCGHKLGADMSFCPMCGSKTTE